MKFKKYMMAFVVLAALVAWAPALSAQVKLELYVDGDGVTNQTMPMGNTVDDNTVVFYDYKKFTVDLKSRVVNADGTTGNTYTIAKSISITEEKRFDVAWNPRSKSYLVVFAKGGKLLGQKVRANGKPKGGAREITNYTGQFWTITESEKKLFVLFLERDGDLVGQLVRKNGKKKKGEVVLASPDTGANYPFDSVSNEEGVAFVVMMNYVDGSTTGDLVSARVDKKLNIIGALPLANQRNLPNALEAAVYCAYSPVDDVYAVTWQYGQGPSSFATVDGQDYFVQEPTLTPNLVTPRGLLYDVALDEFLLHYQGPKLINANLYTEYYITRFQQDGTVVDPEVYLFRHLGENLGYGIGVSGIGSLVLAFSPMAPSVVYGWIMIF